MLTQQKQSILMADDDQAFSGRLKMLLELYGYNVVIVGDGTTALELLDNEEFDLLISELNLAGVDGMQLLKSIKRKRMEMPVIFLTACGEVESYLCAMNMGAFDYLDKSLGNREILSIVRKAIETAAKCHVS